MTWHWAGTTEDNRSVWDWLDNSTGEWTASICPDKVYFKWHQSRYHVRCLHTALEAQYSPEWIMDSIPARGWVVGDLANVQCAQCGVSACVPHLSWCDSTLLNAEGEFVIPLEEHPFAAPATQAEIELRAALYT